MSYGKKNLLEIPRRIRDIGIQGIKWIKESGKRHLKSKCSHCKTVYSYKEDTLRLLVTL